MVDELTGINLDKLIDYDFQGWPIYKKTFRDLLKELGAFEEGNSFIGFDINDPILDICPVRLHDDGMAYGVDEEYFTEANTDGKTYINFFTQKPIDKNQLTSWVDEQREYAKEIKL